jgi:hypothetical protein
MPPVYRLGFVEMSEKDPVWPLSDERKKTQQRPSPCGQEVAVVASTQTHPHSRGFRAAGCLKVRWFAALVSLTHPAVASGVDAATAEAETVGEADETVAVE